jgi:putative ABC transport system permease protein
MIAIALKMLFGDKAKYLGLVFGVAFATLLITQQSAIFVGLMQRTASFISDAREADVWVMDPAVTYLDNTRPMRDAELVRVRAVRGVAWAMPWTKAQGSIKTSDGGLNATFIVGLDDTSLIGLPQKLVVGGPDDLRHGDSVCLDNSGFALLWPNQKRERGRVLELNDRRAVVDCLVDATPPFASMPIIYARIGQARNYIRNGRNDLTFILVRAAADVSPAAVAARIKRETGLQALTGAEFSWLTIRYYLANTGIPINFGAVIALGVIVGVAIVGLTFNMFVAENMKQYAVLKAVGVTNLRLIGMVLSQAWVIGFVGYGIGIGLCAAFFEFATKGNSALRGFFMPWQIALAGAAIVALIMVASTFASLRRVLVVDPATVFRS